MINEFQKLLRPIRNRLARQRALPSLAAALLIGGWLALVAALLTLLGGSQTTGWIGIAVAIGFPAIAFIYAMFRRPSWQSAARLVDRRLQLHNRTSTALHLAETDAVDPFSAMQIDDALSHLRNAKLSDIRLTLPWQRVASGVLLTTFSLALITWGIVAPPSDAIQASGDRQDLRPEIVERTPVEVGKLNAEVIVNSTRFRSGGF